MGFNALILTLYPDMFPGPLGHSLAGRALREGKWGLEALNIRDFATDKHRTVDDSPYGGGAGMVLKPDVTDAALREAKRRLPGARLVYPTPRGALLTQSWVQEYVKEPLIVLCGHFEGVDQRVLEAHEVEEVSLGDYVLSGGEMAAFVLLDACVRLLPGVMGGAESLQEESFAIGQESALLLEYPHYTKPPLWEGCAVPEVLLSGHHAAIQAWRRAQAEEATRSRRPDLWDTHMKNANTKNTKNTKT